MRRKTGRARAEEAELDNPDAIAPGSQPPPPEPTLDEFVSDMFGVSEYTHVKGQLPPIGWLQQKFRTKSAIIRFLYEEGHDVKTIAKQYSLKYQHVRNVLTNELKRGPNEAFRLDNYESPQLKVPALAPMLTPRARPQSEDPEDPEE